jgi:hypothetical protein
MSHPPTMLARLAREQQRELERRADTWGRRRSDELGEAPGDRRTPQLLTRLRTWQHSLHHPHRWTPQHQPQEES